MFLVKFLIEHIRGKLTPGINFNGFGVIEGIEFFDV